MEDVNPSFRRNVYWLGYLGLLPLAVSAILLWLNMLQPFAALAVKGYAAVILTFVGAIHWGRGLDRVDGQLLTISILPSLYAWICILLPIETAIPLLILGFILIFAFDYQQYKKELGWFLKMRFFLTLSISFILLASWYAL